MLVEVCANSLASALNAEAAGANRLELCAELGVGGITPSHGLLQLVRQKITIPVHVLIRPRSGDFTYSETEMEQMRADILHCKNLGFAGVVAGVLHKDLSVDVERTQELVELAGPMAFTFHRAFDWTPDPLAALEALETLGVDWLLSSGQQTSAAKGMELLKTLLGQARKCKIMPGGGVNANNAHLFKEAGFAALHLSGTMGQQTLPAEPHPPMYGMEMVKDHKVWTTQTDNIKALVQCVK